VSPSLPSPFIGSRSKWAGDTSTSIAFVANYLQSLEVTWQEKTGGRKWHAQFESLQAQVNKAGAATAP
jgi:hypothetical protein